MTFGQDRSCACKTDTAIPYNNGLMQDFTEESNHSTACTYHPGQFDFFILGSPAHSAGKRDDTVLLSGWQCCGKSVAGHPGTNTGP